MSRLMSVAYTADAVLERRKRVTRRKGWWRFDLDRGLVVAGDTVTLCRKVMGRKPGEPLERLTDVRITSIRRENLDRLTMTHWGTYGEEEMTLEGFPGLDPAEFIRLYFVDAQRMQASDMVTRIEWEYLDA